MSGHCTNDTGTCNALIPAAWPGDRGLSRFRHLAILVRKDDTLPAVLKAKHVNRADEHFCRINDHVVQQGRLGFMGCT